MAVKSPSTSPLVVVSIIHLLSTHNILNISEEILMSDIGLFISDKI